MLSEGDATTPFSIINLTDQLLSVKISEAPDDQIRYVSPDALKVNSDRRSWLRETTRKRNSASL